LELAGLGRAKKIAVDVDDGRQVRRFLADGSDEIGCYGVRGRRRQILGGGANGFDARLQILVDTLRGEVPEKKLRRDDERPGDEDDGNDAEQKGGDEQPIADAPQQLLSEGDETEDKRQKNKIESGGTARVVRKDVGADGDECQKEREFLKQRCAREGRGHDGWTESLFAATGW
jgi:hypothetical protein